MRSPSRLRAGSGLPKACDPPRTRAAVGAGMSIAVLVSPGWITSTCVCYTGVSRWEGIIAMTETVVCDGELVCVAENPLAPWAMGDDAARLALKDRYADLPEPYRGALTAVLAHPEASRCAWCGDSVGFYEHPRLGIMWWYALALVDTLEGQVFPSCPPCAGRRGVI